MSFKYNKQHDYGNKKTRTSLLYAIKKHPCQFVANHEYGDLNLIGGAKERKDLHCMIRLEDLSFFSEAKTIIRKLCKVIDNKEHIIELYDFLEEVKAYIDYGGYARASTTLAQDVSAMKELQDTYDATLREIAECKKNKK